MGYEMRQNAARFYVAAENQPKALEALKALAARRKLSWLNDPRGLTTKTSLSEALALLGWLTQLGGDDGDIVGIQFDAQNSGDEDAIFGAIAPFVRAGSYIEMRGEEGEIWRWAFDRKTVRTVTPRIDWGETT